MGKVNALWQDEREARHLRYYEEGRVAGFDPETAEDYACDKMDEYDELNGQFGLGA